MSVTRIIGRVVPIFTAAAALASIIALVTLSTNDAADLRRFSVYAVGQASIDLVCLLVLLALAWLSFRSMTLRKLIRHPITALRTTSGRFNLHNCGAAALCALLLISLAINGYGLLRVRGVFWKYLLQKAYVEDVLAEVDQLSTSGRIHDAYALAGQARRILSDEADEGRISNRFRDLSVRVEWSKRLSQRYLFPNAEAWNPTTNRRAYFANAEAVRLDPQNFQAVEVLNGLYSRVVDGIAHDIDQLCGPGRSRIFEATSVLESEIFLDRNHRSCKQAASQWLDSIWQPERIQTLLEAAKEVRTPIVSAPQTDS